MTWREQMLARILLLVAAIFADDPHLAEEVKRLRTTIQVEGPRERERMHDLISVEGLE
jgi:hypothetical protein